MSSTSGSSPARAALVVLAAGEGRRTGHATNKVLLPMSGRPVLAWSLRLARELPAVDRTLLVVREQDRAVVQGILDGDSGLAGVEVVVGGASRHASEWAALRVLATAIDESAVDVVVVHDAARPLAGAELFTAVIGAAAEHGGAVPAVPLTHLVDAEGDRVAQRLVGVQTPQAFRARDLLAAYRAADVEGFEGTDTASCVERYAGLRIAAVPSTPRNLKVTFPEDVTLAATLLET